MVLSYDFLCSKASAGWDVMNTFYESWLSRLKKKAAGRRIQLPRDEAVLYGHYDHGWEPDQVIRFYSKGK